VAATAALWAENLGVSQTAWKNAYLWKKNRMYQNHSKSSKILVSFYSEAVKLSNIHQFSTLPKACSATPVDALREAWDPVS
jgi:hypothetical protein